MASYNLKNAYIFLFKGDDVGYADWGTLYTTAVAWLEAGIPLVLTSHASAEIPSDAALLTYGGADGMLLKMGTGKISWSEKQAVEYSPERGKLDPSRLGSAVFADDDPMDLSFDAVLEYYYGGDTSGGLPNPRDYLQVTTDTGCQPVTADLAVIIAGCGGLDSTEGRGFFFPDFRWESLNFDPSAGQISVSGKCMALTAIEAGYSPA